MKGWRLAVMIFAAGCGGGTPPTPPGLEPAMHAAAEYLVRSCDAEGRFRYVANLDPAAPTPEDYNIVRHAGALYALGMYDRRFPNADVQAALRRAADYMKREALQPVLGEADTLAIWSTPSVSAPGEEFSAKLGATGLGLVGLVEVERVAPGATPRRDLQALARFLLLMQKPDGSFFTEYHPGLGAPTEHWVSLYYPGEAALGWMMLYELDGDPQWRDAAARAVTALAKERRGADDVPLDHWALLATAKLLALTENDEARFPHALWRDHAAQICRSILAARGARTASGDLSGDGHVCRTATRLEGLLAAQTFLPQDEPLHAEIATAAGDGVRFLLDAQVQGGPYAGGFPGFAPQSTAPPPPAPQATEIRVDYVQHALSALLQYSAQHAK